MNLSIRNIKAKYNRKNCFRIIAGRFLYLTNIVNILGNTIPDLNKKARSENLALFYVEKN
ncbi:hypothetical protein IE90_11635 [Sanguibacteroides justesenii]|uniref:Uncharacterized protein n=1 Tax=Sanguibacteroides justesenii TaxID=1547597 RepID=A0AB34R357_9PORP|nr:hypothetical protein IE90_11635 [Sanguibacteroides justesenii]